MAKNLGQGRRRSAAAKKALADNKRQRRMSDDYKKAMSGRWKTYSGKAAPKSKARPAKRYRKGAQ